MSEAVRRLVTQASAARDMLFAAGYLRTSKTLARAIAAVEAELNQKQDIEGTR